jgi:hypothetical protein
MTSLEMEELWDIVLGNLLSDSTATVRLILAKRRFYYEKKGDIQFWSILEAGLPHQNQYRAYKALNKHMGITRRVIAWTLYCDANCSLCRNILFGQATGTFALKIKLCHSCKSRELVSEFFLQKNLPAVIPIIPARLKFCWLPHGINNLPMKHYRKSEVFPLLRCISFF